MNKSFKNRILALSMVLSMLALASTTQASQVKDFEVNINGIFHRPRQQLSVDRALLMSPTVEGARYATRLLSEHSYFDLRDALFAASVAVEITPPSGKTRNSGRSGYEDCMEDNYRNRRHCASEEAARVYRQARLSIRSLNDLSFFWDQMSQMRESFFNHSPPFLGPTDPLPGIASWQIDNAREAYRLLVAAGEDAYKHPTRLQGYGDFSICSMATRLAIAAGEKEGSGIWGKAIDMAGPIGYLMSGNIPALLETPHNFNRGVVSNIEYSMILAQRDADGRPTVKVDRALDECLLHAEETISKKVKDVRETNRQAKSAAMAYNGGRSTSGAAITLMTTEMVTSMHNRAQDFIPKAYRLYRERYGQLVGVRFTNLPVLVGNGVAARVAASAPLPALGISAPESHAPVADMFEIR